MGLNYIYKKTNNIALSASNKLQNNIREIFDETYENQLKSLQQLKERFSNTTKKFEVYLSNYDLREYENAGCQEIALKTIFQRFSLQKENLLVSLTNISSQIDKKINSPSLTPEISIPPLEGIKNDIQEIRNILERHNSLIENRKSEQENFKTKLKSYLRRKTNSDIKQWEKEDSEICKNIKEIRLKSQKDCENKNLVQAKISEIEDNLTSSKPSINAINSILRSSGFYNFELVPDDESRTHTPYWKI
ncbi:hypothetical protein FAI40_02765 [Acetobacteraceae bacterium]|nr:hypothetical protein FAI40_02765 [Acetobacteraceae bacterium]